MDIAEAGQSHRLRISQSCDRLEKRLADQNITLEFTDRAKDYVANKGYDPVYGARPLKRAIQAQLENPLSKAILEGRFAAKDTIRVDVGKSGAFTFTKAVLH